MSKLSETLEQYIKENHISIRQLARELGVPRTTVRDWITKSKEPSYVRYREILEKKFVGIFNEERVIISIGSQEEVRKLKKKINPVELEVKVFLAQQQMSGLDKIFDWLLFEATVEERNYFRDSLGEQWNQFLNRAQAMLSETALKVLKSEGRIQPLTERGKKV